MKICVIENIGIDGKEFIDLFRDFVREDSYEIQYYDDKPSSREEIIKRGRNADIVVVSTLSLDRDIISQFENVKLIDVAFTGLDHIDVDYCKNKGIKVMNSDGYSTDSVCELVFGMIISLYRNMILNDKLVRDGKVKDDLGLELFGKKIGIIGTGKIGLRVAQIANAFGMKVYAYSRSIKDIDYIKYVSLNELLSNCDVISIHVPLNRETRNMLNKDRLKLLKRDAIVINTARGGIIDNEYLTYMLNNDLIGGAGIDVFDMEPPLDKDYCLNGAKNIILTPHIGYATKEAIEKRTNIVIDNICNFLSNRV